MEHLGLVLELGFHPVRDPTQRWGYGTGVAAATHSATGDVVVAEYTQPVNHQDVTWAAPLWDHLTTTLGQPPTNLAADAAFDAWHVYDLIARQGAPPPSPQSPGPAAPRPGDRSAPLCARLPHGPNHDVSA